MSEFQELKKNEFAQKVSRKIFVEQGGTGTESGDLYLDYRPCGKRKKLPSGDETKDHSRLGLEAFRERKNIRESEMKFFPRIGGETVTGGTI